MRTKPLLLLLALAAHPASLRAQLTAAPALKPGTEASITVTQPAVLSTSTAGAGAAGAIRHAGRLNLAARFFYLQDPGQGSSAELATFGAFDRLSLPGDVDLGWVAGVGYNSGPQGLYLPVGLTASREMQIGSAWLTPFAQARALLQQIDPSERATGSIGAEGEFGVDLRIHSGWSVRAGVATSSIGTSSGIGVARRL